MNPEAVDTNKFVLRPCKVLENHFVLNGGSELTMNWRQLCRRFAPARGRAAILTLRGLQTGGYLGVARNPAGPSLFFYLNANRTGEILSTIIKDQEWASRVIEVFLVENAQWASKLTELSQEM